MRRPVDLTIFSSSLEELIRLGLFLEICGFSALVTTLDLPSRKIIIYQYCLDQRIWKKLKVKKTDSLEVKGIAYHAFVAAFGSKLSLNDSMVNLSSLPLF